MKIDTAPEDTRVEMNTKRKKKSSKIKSRDPELALLSEDQIELRYKPTNCCEQHCCGGLANMPCGYPPGTFRSLIALIIVVVTEVGLLGILAYAAATGNQTVVNVIIPLLASSLTGVLGFYFGSRSSGGSASPPTSPTK